MRFGWPGWPQLRFGCQCAAAEKSEVGAALLIPQSLLLVSINSLKSVYLDLAAFTALQTGQNLTLDGLNPGIPLLEAGCLKVPRLPSAGHDQELKVFLWVGGWERL